uniref:Uncharacterized protein n=1 Tax=uncultured marine virus TaxID=186617 RepID=A0A0F7L197_9VIRU|nr:hypothetical protein [uncultured marine virus]
MKTLKFSRHFRYMYHLFFPFLFPYYYFDSLIFSMCDIVTVVPSQLQPNIPLF